MDRATIRPIPPNLAGLTWGPIGPADLAALVELAQECLLADGGLGFLFEPEALKDLYFPDAPGATIGACAPDERLVACAAISLDGEAGTPRATLVGQVRPDLRNRGLGTYLMGWSQAQAQSLLDGAAAGRRVLRIRTESLTEPAHHLYQAHGYERVFDELVMRRDLLQPLQERPLPAGVSLATWQPDLAEQFYQAYYPAFRERPGFPGWSAAEWIGRVTGNDLVPEWSLLAREEGAPIGFVIGDIDLTTDPPGGYIQQIGVIPAWRRRGLASALLAETMRRMRAAGSDWALLTVHLNNPGAIQSYAQLGFETIGRRARYERVIESEIRE